MPCVSNEERGTNAKLIYSATCSLGGGGGCVWSGAARLPFDHVCAEQCVESLGSVTEVSFSEVGGSSFPVII